MENQNDNIPEETQDSQQTYNSADISGQQYTDPNAGQQPYQDPQYQNQQYQYTNQNNDYNQYQSGYNYNQQQNYNYNQQNGYNYQDNYSYNTGTYNQAYEPGMDNSPRTMGDWALTILASCIPCFGIVIYFVWAFSKKGNVNRRNYCRASLIITGVILAVYLVFMIIFGVAIFSASGTY